MPQCKIPADGVEIIFLVCEDHVQIIAQDIRDQVKAFETAIIIDYCFCTT